MFYNEPMKTIRGLLLLSGAPFQVKPALAAERAGDLPDARRYFAAVLASAGDGAHAPRPELIHAKSLQ